MPSCFLGSTPLLHFKVSAETNKVEYWEPSCRLGDLPGVIAIYGERVVTPAMDVLNESGSSAGRGLIPSGDSPFFPALGTARKIQFAFFPRES